ncbi:hypothetical protein TRFO_31335 [Tritrichomonas foetus]|uniref:Uncharacterized protein n=1 Tax=Tritrichomonas foetus TaxID=1144522 RepID=A0A1J4JWS4_9EUKA|nr:hypothetical protein TRFO_31335 [Tritrichomonas foetus]|eukprot:OHT01725.1 hypothetical protein TRFO_31335 [Tritrichomonas foetus]
MSHIGHDKLYEYMEKINSGSAFDVSPDSVLESIERSFQTYEPIHAQNILNFLVEEYSFFSSCKNIFERVKNLCTILINSDQLSSKTVGVTAQTKLWIINYKEVQGVEYFVNYLFTSALDAKADVPPHLRTVYTQCLLELYYANPELINLSDELLIEESTKNMIPTAFPEMAYAKSGKTQQLDEFFEKRWWSLSPFESVMFSKDYNPPFPLVPNDPLLLHTAMAANKVPKDTALSLINSPLSQFGVPTVLLGFKDIYDVDGESLFTPYDSNELIAAKSQLLAPNIKSIEENTNLVDFVNEQPDNSLVIAVFAIASRFGPDDLFMFFSRFFKTTESFDRHWFNLFQSQKPNVQHTLRTFLSLFPDRKICSQVLLETNNPPLSAINNANDPTLFHYLKRLSGNQGSIEAAFATDKLNQLKNSDDPIIREAALKNMPKINYSGSNVDPNFKLEIIDDQFLIEDRTVSTTGRTKTTIVLTIRYKPATPIYGVEFTLSNSEFFEFDGLAMLPTMTDFKQVRFEMKPRKAGTCRIDAICSYTTSEGESQMARLGEIEITVDEFLSPHEADFATAWNEGEEARLVLPINFSKFVEKINDVVFGRVAERQEENRLQATVVTPDGHVVCFKAENIGPNSTNVMFKAPTIEMLVLIDQFLRNLFNAK